MASFIPSANIQVFPSGWRSDTYKYAKAISEEHIKRLQDLSQYAQNRNFFYKDPDDSNYYILGLGGYIFRFQSGSIPTGTTWAHVNVIKSDANDTNIGAIMVSPKASQESTLDADNNFEGLYFNNSADPEYPSSNSTFGHYDLQIKNASGNIITTNLRLASTEIADFDQTVAPHSIHTTFHTGAITAESISGASLTIANNKVSDIFVATSKSETESPSGWVNNALHANEANLASSATFAHSSEQLRYQKSSSLGPSYIAATGFAVNLGNKGIAGSVEEPWKLCLQRVALKDSEEDRTLGDPIEITQAKGALYDSEELSKATPTTLIKDKYIKNIEWDSENKALKYYKGNDSETINIQYAVKSGASGALYGKASETSEEKTLDAKNIGTGLQVADNKLYLYNGILGTKISATGVTIPYATNATNAKKAEEDESGNNIKSSYAASIGNNTTTKEIQLLNKNGAQIGAAIEVCYATAAGEATKLSTPTQGINIGGTFSIAGTSYDGVSATETKTYTGQATETAKITLNKIDPAMIQGGITTSYPNLCGVAGAFGGATNLRDALTYIAKVFAGDQEITKLVTNSLVLK